LIRLVSMETEEVKRFVTSKPEGLDNNYRPVKVLVVDDEPIVRSLVSQVLRSVGYEVVGEAQDGASALTMCVTHRPEIVILDVQMPVMDGMAALERIRREHTRISVVMLTNMADKETVQQIIAAGARDYIVKPVDRKLILAKLRKVRGVKD
jgi:CheY-like chemotaxis protein